MVAEKKEEVVVYFVECDGLENCGLRGLLLLINYHLTKVKG